MSKAVTRGMLAATLGILAAGGGLPLEEMPRMRAAEAEQEPTAFDEERIRKAEEKRERKQRQRSGAV